jgi:REP element-mobilizing transposase RayT
MAGAYFITVCAARRGAVFGDVTDAGVRLNDVGRITADCLVGLPHHHDVVLDASIVMPDHVHAVVMLGVGRARPHLSVVVGTFKAAVARKTRIRGMWQRGFYDHVVRDDVDLDRVRDYIDGNPGRWFERRGETGRIYPAPTQDIRGPGAPELRRPGS